MAHDDPDESQEVNMNIQILLSISIFIIILKNMLGYLSITCSEKRTVFLEFRSRKAFRFSEQIMSADKYRSMFSRQMEVIVYIIEQTGDENKGIHQIEILIYH